jgi:hypothetical protein
MRITLDIDADEVVISSKRTTQSGKVEMGSETPLQPVSIEVNDAGSAPKWNLSETGPLAMIVKPSSAQEGATPIEPGDTINAGAAPDLNPTSYPETSGITSEMKVKSTDFEGTTIVDAGPAPISHS